VATVLAKDVDFDRRSTVPLVKVRFAWTASLLLMNGRAFMRGAKTGRISRLGKSPITVFCASC